MTTTDKLEIIEALAGHLIALIVVTGFIGLGYITVLGLVDLSNATVSGFLGTLIGAVGTKVEAPLARYFGRMTQTQPAPTAQKKEV